MLLKVDLHFDWKKNLSNNKTISSYFSRQPIFDFLNTLYG